MIKKKDEDKSPLVRQLALLGTIPVILVVGPLIGLFIGRLLDGWLGTDPYLMILFLVLGFVASGKELYNLVRKLNKDL